MQQTQKIKGIQRSSTQFFVKRSLDVCFSLIALITFLPIYIAIALLILMTEGWPIFFIQERPGLDGRPFRIFKFRTMRTAESHLDDSQRLTSLGRFLRSLSLDELPEFWNVLVGDMSLVGPRPLLMSYLARYSSEQLRRHDIRPGITGWAQINGRNRLDWEKRFELDLWYIDHQSLRLDLQILFQTVLKVFLKHGISAAGAATMHEFKGMEKQSAETKILKIEMSSADISENDIASVVEVLRSGRLALGPKTIEFENKVAAYVGVKHAIAVSSGTAALHLIVKSLGIGKGDEVLVPSFTFAASVNAILYEGATPIFVDLEPDTYNMDPKDFERHLTPRTRAIMVVDVFGHPADWDAIQRFADKNGLLVIDDCCEALGSEYRGKKLGSFGAAGAFAFYPNKQITTGEGGMIVTNDDRIARLARSYRNQGRDEMGQWLEHPRLGYNYRLDEMSAALGCSQFDRLDEFVARRAKVAKLYSEKLAVLESLSVPCPRAEVKMSWFVYVITLSAEYSASAVIKDLAKRGIPSRAYFSPIHEQPYLQEICPSREVRLPRTRKVSDRTIALPFHNLLTGAEIDFVVEQLASVLRSYAPQKELAG